MRILIAEDETIIRLDLRELLEKAGFDVCAEARDGEEAVTLARTVEPDLALLDVKMPKLDGIDAARRILDERPIPIVMVTAYGEEELVSRAVEAGVFGYLVKPFRETDLLPAIATARARHEELAALREEADSLAEALAARKAIERAKGLLMEREGLTEQDAFARLRKASQISGRPLKVVAEALIATLDATPRRLRCVAARSVAGRYGRGGGAVESPDDGAVESRSTRRVASSTRSVSTRCPSMSLVSRLTAMRPISSRGCRTVVSAGVTTRASSESSNPTTERWSRDARYSDRLQRASHRSPCCRSRRRSLSAARRATAAGGPPVSVRHLEVAPDDELRRGSTPAPASAAWYPFPRSSVATQPRRPGDHPRCGGGRARADARSPPAPAQCVADTTGMRWSSGIGASMTTNGNPSVPSSAQLRGRLGRQHEDGTVGRAAQEPLDEGGLAVVLVAGRAEDGAHLLLVERLGGAGQDPE